jgi:hypothetical protein
MNRFCRAVRQLCAAHLAGCASQPGGPRLALVVLEGRALPSLTRAEVSGPANARLQAQFTGVRPAESKAHAAAHDGAIAFQSVAPQVAHIQERKDSLEPLDQALVSLGVGWHGLSIEKRVKFRVLPRFPLWGRFW